jgi:hypothetical protein
MNQLPYPFFNLGISVSISKELTGYMNKLYLAMVFLNNQREIFPHVV